MKQNTNSQILVYKTIENIISSGGKHLYNKQIGRKIPSHTSQAMNRLLYETLSVQENEISKKVTSRQDKLKNNVLVDNYATFKIATDIKPVIQPYQPEIISKMTPKSKLKNRLFKKYQTLEPNIAKNNIKKSIKVTISNKKQSQSEEKYLKMKKIDLSWRDQSMEKKDEQARKQIIKNRLQVKDKVTLLKKRQLQNQCDHKLRIKEFKEMKSSNKPRSISKKTKQDITNFQYLDGKLLLGFKKNQIERNSVVHMTQNRISTELIKRPETSVKGVKGKRRTFIQQIIKKKQPEFNPEQYNNNGIRQFSHIPYIQMNSGSKVTEIQVPIIASKRKSHQPSRSDYVTDTERTSFKSYLNNADKSVKINQTSSSQRGELTTRNEHRVIESARQSKIENQTWNTNRDHFLLRPRTTEQNDVKVNLVLLQQILQ